MTSELSLRAIPGAFAPLQSPSPSTAAVTVPLPRLPGTKQEATVDGSVVGHAATAATDVLGRAAQRVADSLGSGNSFNFMVDGETGMTIVKVINRSTGELVRQIPSEEIVHIAQLLQKDEHHPVLDVKA